MRQTVNCNHDLATDRGCGNRLGHGWAYHAVTGQSVTR